MGAGGRELAAGQQFRIYIKFENAADGSQKSFDPDTDTIYREFVRAITAAAGVFSQSAWTDELTVRSSKSGRDEVYGATLLLDGPLTLPRALNLQVNTVLIGMRTHRGSNTLTGFAARVADNQGPGTPKDLGPLNGVNLDVFPDGDMPWKAP